MYSNTLVHLERFKIWREDFSLISVATVVHPSKGTSYKLLALMTSLFVWCMSGAPRVFDGKHALVTSLFLWCVSSAPRVFDGKMCTRDKLIRVVRHMWLMVNLMCTRDEFARVVHV